MIYGVKCMYLESLSLLDIFSCRFPLALDRHRLCFCFFLRIKWVGWYVYCKRLCVKKSKEASLFLYYCYYFGVLSLPVFSPQWNPLVWPLAVILSGRIQYCFILPSWGAVRYRQPYRHLCILYNSLRFTDPFWTIIKFRWKVILQCFNCDLQRKYPLLL